MNIFNHFQHLSLSPDQRLALEKLEAFLSSSTQVFMLKGFAGSGKTTILKGLSEFLHIQETNFTLMAPTGRAAKVIREKTGQEAYTIHKTIYCYEEMNEIESTDKDGSSSFFYYYKIRNNIDVAKKIFIVDEASMLSDAKNEGEFFRFGTGHLLSDLITYTRVATDTAKSKIIFVGDPCQLAPVGDNSSKAFDRDYFTQKFKVSIDEVEMKEVKRHGEDSGILKTASKIRKSISSGYFNDFNLSENKKDIFNPTYELFFETWKKVGSPKIIIASKNKTCLDINLQIRQLKYGKANLPVQKGDIVIMGGNNYRKGVFNGEFAVVNEVSDEPTVREILLKGKSPIKLRWRNIELVFPDAENKNKAVTGQVLENFLYGDNSLRPEEMQALFVDFKNRHKDLKPKTKEFKEAIISDEYFNCLLIKYGYAVTCHKAQGGEWDNVFTIWDNDNRQNFNCFTEEQIKSGKTNEGFYRWAYTAITRASQRLFAINPPTFHSYSLMSILNPEVIVSLNELTGTEIRTEEIEIDNSLMNQLKQFNLLEQPLLIQDHFIKVNHIVSKQYVDVVGWEKKNMEILYKFRREDKTAGIKTWINKDCVFNGKYLNHPTLTNNEDFYKEIETLLKHLPNISIKRNTTETILSKIEFDEEVEERFPFTKNLFDDLLFLLSETGISIDNINHLEYKERYTFKCNTTEIATLDFEYNKDGFWGRVLPLNNKVNSQKLLSDIQKVLLMLKQQDYAR